MRVVWSRASLQVFSALLESNSDSAVKKSTYSDKAGGEPGLSVGPPSPPPVCVRSIKHTDNIPSFESQLLLLHGHMVPESLGIHSRPRAYPLRHKQTELLQAHTYCVQLTTSGMVVCYVDIQVGIFTTSELLQLRFNRLRF